MISTGEAPRRSRRQTSLHEIFRLGRKPRELPRRGLTLCVAWFGRTTEILTRNHQRVPHCALSSPPRSETVTGFTHSGSSNTAPGQPCFKTRRTSRSRLSAKLEQPLESEQTSKQCDAERAYRRYRLGFRSGKGRDPKTGEGILERPVCDVRCRRIRARRRYPCSCYRGRWCQCSRRSSETRRTDRS